MKKEEIEKLWLNQLAKEHEYLSWAYQAALAPVCFELSSNCSKWGTWDPMLRKITISRSLIENHPWNIVLEVLRHEMAHQYVSENFSQAEDSSVHGELFLKACQKLGTATWATAASINEDDLQYTKEGQDAGDRILRRAKKLLALGDSSNSFEAEAAMQKVRDLYQKYNLDHIEQGEKEEYEQIFITHKRRRLESYQSMIASMLSQYFFVYVVQGELFDAHLGVKFKHFELLGLPHNTKMAEYMYWFVHNHCESLWHDYKRVEKLSGRTAKNQFYQGVVKGFSEKLHREDIHNKAKQKEETQENTLALISKQEELAEEFAEYKHPRLITSRRKVYYTADAKSYLAGFQKGQDLNFYHGVNNKQKGQKSCALPAQRS